MAKLIDLITEKDDLVNCEEAIDKMIHHLKLIKNDLNDEYNLENTNINSLKIRLIGFNVLNDTFQDYVSQIL